MADSSSVQDTSARSSLLTIKAIQNLIIDLSPVQYDSYMLEVVECLKYSPLATSLTKVDAVPMSHLSKVYSTVTYDKGKERVFFELFY